MEIAQLALNNNHSLTHSFIEIELTAYDVYCLSNIIGWTLFRVKPNNVKLIVILLYYTALYEGRATETKDNMLECCDIFI
jgi:hypothetical protein